MKHTSKLQDIIKNKKQKQNQKQNQIIENDKFVKDEFNQIDKSNEIIDKKPLFFTHSNKSNQDKDELIIKNKRSTEEVEGSKSNKIKGFNLFKNQISTSNTKKRKFNKEKKDEDEQEKHTAKEIEEIKRIELIVKDIDKIKDDDKHNNLDSNEDKSILMKNKLEAIKKQSLINIKDKTINERLNQKQLLNEILDDNHSSNIDKNFELLEKKQYENEMKNKRFQFDDPLYKHDTQNDSKDRSNEETIEWEREIIESDPYQNGIWNNRNDRNNKHNYKFTNRYRILPDSRYWDGIDRTNGFEGRLLNKRSQNKPSLNPAMGIGHSSSLAKDDDINHFLQDID